MSKDIVMKVTTKVLEVIQEHRTDACYLSSSTPISPKVILYTYGSGDEFRRMISDLENKFNVNFNTDHIGEFTVQAFIDMVISTVQESRHIKDVQVVNE